MGQCQLTQVTINIGDVLFFLGRLVTGLVMPAVLIFIPSTDEIYIILMYYSFDRSQQIFYKKQTGVVIRGR